MFKTYLRRICFFLGLQQFGVIPFEIRTLKKRHTEKWRARRIVYNKAILTQRHRWCVEKQRIFASFINTLVYFITKQWFARLVKNVYYQSYQQYVHYISVALCAFGTSVILSAFTSVFSPSLCDFYMQWAYFITPYFGRTFFLYVREVIQRPYQNCSRRNQKKFANNFRFVREQFRLYP